MIAARTDLGVEDAVTRVDAATPVEKHLHFNGFPALAQAMRSARLASPTHGIPDWLHRLQTQFNLPFLIASATLLLGHLHAEGEPRVLFSCHDGRHLKDIFDVLRDAAGLCHPVSDSWLTSRLAQACTAPEYLAYCRPVLEGRPTVVELCASGLALGRLFARLGLQADPPGVFFCEFVADAAQGPSQPPTDVAGPAPALRPLSLLSTRSFVAAEVLELLNATGEGTVRSVMPLAGTHLAVRLDPPFDGADGELVRSQAAFVGALTEHLRTTVHAAGAFDEITRQAPQLLSALHDAASMLRPEIETLLRTLLPALRRHEALLGRELLRALA